MKIIVTENEKKLLEQFKVIIDYTKDYDEDEMLDLIDEMRDQEVFYIDRRDSHKYGLLVDRIQDEFDRS